MLEHWSLSAPESKHTFMLVSSLCGIHPLQHSDLAYDSCRCTAISSNNVKSIIERMAFGCVRSLSDSPTNSSANDGRRCPNDQCCWHTCTTTQRFRVCRLMRLAAWQVAPNIQFRSAFLQTGLGTQRHQTHTHMAGRFRSQPSHLVSSLKQY
jgi:hypothetical protein